MEMRIEAGWISGARKVFSSNFDARPNGTEISLLVIHGISLPPGEFGGACIEEFFANKLDPGAHPYFSEICDLQVSAHFLIRRDGELVQFVSTADRAWHAGESSYDGVGACNDYSIGIELEGTDDSEYEERQYDRLVRTTLALMEHYPLLTADRIVRHSDVSPGRKTDPGPAFDLSRYLLAVNLATGNQDPAAVSTRSL